jgi:hypothetical protein
MNRILSILSASAIVAGAYVTFGAPADARTLGSFAGNCSSSTACIVPNSNPPKNCFSETNGGITQNNCSSTLVWEVGHAVDTATTFDPVVAGFWPSASVTFQCNACVTDINGNLGCPNGLRSPTHTGNVTINELNVSVPGAGLLFSACLMGPGVKWYSTTW